MFKFHKRGLKGKKHQWWRESSPILVWPKSRMYHLNLWIWMLHWRKINQTSSDAKLPDTLLVRDFPGEKGQDISNNLTSQFFLPSTHQFFIDCGKSMCPVINSVILFLHFAGGNNRSRIDVTSKVNVFLDLTLEDKILHCYQNLGPFLATWKIQHDAEP